MFDVRCEILIFKTFQDELFNLHINEPFHFINSESQAFIKDVNNNRFIHLSLCASFESFIYDSITVPKLCE